MPEPPIADPTTPAAHSPVAPSPAAPEAAPTTPAGLVIALDGPGSSGKSSVGAAAALELGYRFCDTGLLYRAVTWLSLHRDVAETDVEALVSLVSEVELAADAEGRLARVLVDGRDVTEEVRAPDVDAAVSAVSRVPELRAALLDRQRLLAAPGRIIVAGRDIGTVVLPDADLKLFLTASVAERARRRAEERRVNPDRPEGRAILADLRRRDQLDSSRAVAPLRPADDARVLLTDGNRFDETVKLVVDAIRKAEASRPSAGDPRTARKSRRKRRGPQAPEVASASDPADSAEGSRPPRVPAPAEPVTPLAHTPIESHQTLLIRFVAWAARLITRAVTHVTLEGDVDAIPRAGPVILAANHASNADPVVIGAWLTPRLGRRIHWLGKKELFDWPVIGWMARNGGVHPVDRSRADLEAFRLAQRILEEGHLLMVFPEGTRSPDGALQPARDGLAMLALRTGAPIVPIAVVDSDRRWPRGRLLPRPGGRITLRIGEPFRLADDPATSGRGRAAKGAATDRLMGRIAALLPPRQRGAYAAQVPEAPASADEA
ncbi:MAG: (d)CMP kinase [Chloroflexi bacterium]|nr:(d)CMP kinase [Chloroflexota bacterium]